jgi:magnesium chelatase family protein
VLASVASATLLGVDGHVVTVEVHVSSGLPAFTIVGLPDTIVRESRERVRAALLSSKLPWPTHRITVNLCRTRTPRVRDAAQLGRPRVTVGDECRRFDLVTRTSELMVSER